MIKFNPFSAVILFFLLGNFLYGIETVLNKKILDNDTNGSKAKGEIVRVIKPGVFDYQTKDFMIRMRAWGVGFPQRDQPGYNEAITFT